MPPPLTRREFGFLALAQAVRRKPNILFILIDDFGWNGLSCYGNKDVATPHIDKLASQGMRFTAAYAEPQCSPTRAALLSGQYGARTGLFKVIHEKEPPNTYLTIPEANLAMQPEMATLATDLRAAGYTTGIIGKWHIADQYAAADVRERDGGRYFDRYGFDFASPVPEKMHAADKAVTALTDETLGFIERAGSKPWTADYPVWRAWLRCAKGKGLLTKVARGCR